MLNLDVLRRKVFQFDGLQVTVGGLVIAAALLYFWKRRKR